jgi:hypothetical protein
MKIIETYSHLNGLEYLLVRKKALWKEVRRVIQAVDGHTCNIKPSKGYPMPAKPRYSPKRASRTFSELLTARGWTESKLSVAAGNESISRCNTSDFLKDRVAIEVQFGKKVFEACDLFMSHLASYVRDQIDVGIEILAMTSPQADIKPRLGYYQGELHNLIRVRRGVPAVPLVLIGVEP